jgi:hypothetical protein
MVRGTIDMILPKDMKYPSGGRGLVQKYYEMSCCVKLHNIYYIHVNRTLFLAAGGPCVGRRVAVHVYRLKVQFLVTIILFLVRGLNFPWKPSGFAGVLYKNIRNIICSNKTCYESNFKVIRFKIRGFSPQANYTDRATAACRRS